MDVFVKYCDDYENVYDKNDMLRNGDRLVSYLVNLEYPYNIDSIYKDISKYLDVNFFSKISWLYILSIFYKKLQYFNTSLTILYYNR